MKVIAELVDRIDEEINDAKEYAELAISRKAENDQAYYQKFKTIASEELNHATIVHDYAVVKINALKAVYTPPVEMLEAWEKSHAKYVEKTAWVKTMLTM